MVKFWCSKSIKRLVCNPHNGQYLTPAGQWTKDETQAKNFPSIFQALEFCCERQVNDAELVFKFQDGRSDVTLPMNEMSTGHDLSWTRFRHLHQPFLEE